MNDDERKSKTLTLNAENAPTEATTFYTRTFEARATELERHFPGRQIQTAQADDFKSYRLYIQAEMGALSEAKIAQTARLQLLSDRATPERWTTIDLKLPEKDWKMCLQRAVECMMPQDKLTVTHRPPSTPIPTTPVHMVESDIPLVVNLLTQIQEHMRTGTRFEMSAIMSARAFDRLHSGLGKAKLPPDFFSDVSLDIDIEGGARVDTSLRVLLGEKPEIESLRLAYASSYSLQSFEARKLRSLELVAPLIQKHERGTTAAPATTSDWKLFVRALGTMERLEKLRLEGVLPYTSGQELEFHRSETEQLQLGELVGFDVYDDLNTVSLFYDLLKAPKLERFGVRVAHLKPSSNPANFTSTVRNLFKTIHEKLDIGHFQSLDLTLKPSAGGNTGEAQDVVVTMHLEDKASEIPTATLTFDTNLSGSIELISQAIGLMPNLTALSLRTLGDHSVYSGVLVDALGTALHGALNVKTLELRDEGANWIGIALLESELSVSATSASARDAKLVSNEAPVALFPSLSQVRIVDNNWKTSLSADSPLAVWIRKHTTPTPSPDEAQLPFLPTLRSVLLHRLQLRLHEEQPAFDVFIDGPKTDILTEHVEGLKTSGIPGLTLHHSKDIRTRKGQDRTTLESVDSSKPEILRDDQKLGTTQ
ncbi:unnamed protein product [Peniophora sp. CBMAI 1063]|nr:unnamed protein product [Peniophora sp. CBMAI 1063]